MYIILVISNNLLCNQNKLSKSNSTLDNYYFVKNNSIQQKQEQLLCPKFSSKPVYLNATNNNNIININSNNSNFDAFQSVTENYHFNRGFNTIPSQMSQSVSEQITSLSDNKNLHKNNIYQWPLTSKFLTENECQSMANIKINSTPNTFQRQKIDHSKLNLCNKKNVLTARAKSLDDVTKYIFFNKLAF